MPGVSTELYTHPAPKRNHLPNGQEKLVQHAHPDDGARPLEKGRRRSSKAEKPKKQDDSLIGSLCSTIVDHQIGLSVNLLLLLVLTHICFPRARRRTRKFLSLSYYDPETGLYTQGLDDIPFVVFWIIVFTGLRVVVMDYVLIPFARWGGIRKEKAMVRLAEQGWLLVYYSVFWTLGMYIMYNSDYWLNLKELWTDFPTRSTSGLMKWYYLVQFAFWIQQIIVVNIEERRNDYHQMFTHHIITCILMLFSYGYYQTKVGNLILSLMDLVDIVLPLAKILKYFRFQTACDVAFGVFILTWVVTRHIFYPMVCWSIHADVPSIMHYGCYDSTTGAKISSSGGSDILKHIFQGYTNPGGEVCFNERIRWAFLGLLLALQVITLMWFIMIVSVAVKVLSGKGADDSRSDDEECGDEDDLLSDIETAVKDGMTHVPQSAKPLEKEVGVEGLNFTRQSSPRVKGKAYRQSSGGIGGRASGISIPGHGDRKELLGRIGCDKTTS
ncbi:longevity assurance proteins LAG1/LAC1 [Patellaria atrata CBS 101060]|uniref:Longevity assurance proteins LAG1/LAC1 n=1 Tax=Patellaria atrata CBS 101060 TaxID=1346257 RepID=A0A9P4SK30_9PEZI|nr:longevity assurance proteins LAG1/LAC1 [Patellaria atrata CBS 101060]